MTFVLEDQANSGIPTKRWISQILYRRCELKKQERDFLFSGDNRRKAIIGDYDTIFKTLLERGRNMHPELFTTGVFIGGFSIRRSPRIGATTEAENKDVDSADIELINR